MLDTTVELLKKWAETYNSPEYFQEDPIIFPKEFTQRMERGEANLKDVEIAAIFASHFAWGRRSMIVRDSKRLMDEMGWAPYDYVMKGNWRSGSDSAHRTVRWDDVAAICSRLKLVYLQHESLEELDRAEIRTMVFGQKPDAKAADKKINMMRRWMVRDDGKVDLGVWKNTNPADLLIPLDVHVHNVASSLELTTRRQKDILTVREITEAFNNIFPGDPCKGDFSLFGYGVTHPKKTAESRECTL